MRPGPAPGELGKFALGSRAQRPREPVRGRATGIRS